MAGASEAKRAVKEQAAALGIDGIGFTDASPLEQVSRALDEAASRGYLPADIAPTPATVLKMTTPTRHMKRARSVISAYEAYYTDEAGPDDPLTGPIARYTRANYYGDLRRRLGSLAAFIGEAFGAKTKVLCCYVSLAEKALAVRAGIGFYGKHGVIITPRHGSFVVLGEILTDLELEVDAGLDQECGSCTRCIDACPAGALRTPYFVDRHLCIQAHCGRRTTVPPAVREAWATRFYGCTACQDACPHNARLEPVDREVCLGRIGAAVALAEILNISEADFETRFRQNQIGRRERNVIRRCAIIAAGNSRAEVFLDPLAACARDADPMVRQHAFWAISRILGGAAKPLLVKAREAEPDVAVREEIKTLLDGTGGLA